MDGSLFLPSPPASRTDSYASQTWDNKINRGTDKICPIHGEPDLATVHTVSMAGCIVVDPRADLMELERDQKAGDQPS